MPPTFTFVRAKTPKDLVNGMIAAQVYLFDKPFDLPYIVLVRNMKLLLKKYSLEQVRQGLVDAVHVAEHPFSTAFIKEMIERAEESRQVYQNYKENHDDNL